MKKKVRHTSFKRGATVKRKFNKFGKYHHDIWELPTAYKNKDLHLRVTYARFDKSYKLYVRALGVRDIKSDQIDWCPVIMGNREGNEVNSNK